MLSLKVNSTYRYHHEDAKDVQLDVRLVIINQMHRYLVTGDQQGGHRAGGCHLVLEGAARMWGQWHSH